MLIFVLVKQKVMIHSLKIMIYIYFCKFFTLEFLHIFLIDFVCKEIVRLLWILTRSIYLSRLNAIESCENKPLILSIPKRLSKSLRLLKHELVVFYQFNLNVFHFCPVFPILLHSTKAHDFVHPNPLNYFCFQTFYTISIVS